MRQEGYKQLAGNTGYLLLKIPQDILDEIKILVDGIQNDFSKATPYNHALVGQIDKEYRVNLNRKTSNYIQNTVDLYNNHNPNYLRKIGALSTKFPRLSYDGECWVNFQRKYEYNPMHTHHGVFSYVIWYQIPFYKENEIKYGAGKVRVEKNNLNGDFLFLYSLGGEILLDNLGIDKRMEGYMALFPSSLNHIVYPFYTSDDYRITISGNILLQG